MIPAVAAWATEVLDGLRTSLDTSLAAVDRSPCFLAIVPGDQVVADHCGCGTHGCGMGWVRLVRVFHSTRFPAPDTAPVNLSVRAPLAMAVEVGVMRCQPVMTGTQMPTAAQQINATLDQVADMQAVHDAIACCPEVSARTNVIAGYLPLSGGGCGGGAWTVTVQLRPIRNPGRP